ncbi:HAMP domain-containing protein [Bdellovibrio bacteriovorus]|uniref:HAMP domain-containing protein n=1 Tax=Bdellovibrio TaxID=958 RepID=UPI0035A8B1F3
MSLWNKLKEQRHSLTSTTLTAVLLRVSLVVGITAFITYWHLSREIEKTSLQTLEKYVRERSLRERDIFKLAADNHYALRKDLIEVFRKIEKSKDDPVQEFNSLVKKDPDGALRSPRSKPGVKKELDIWIAKNSRSDALFRRKVVAFSKVLLRYAPAFHVRFTDTYIALSENANLVYWPEFPDWSAGNPANFDFSSYELYQIGKKQHNPERKTRWSGVYFDDAIGKWMVSASTPFDDSRGYFAGIIGHDVMIDDLIERTTNDGLAGTYNILISGEGRLIAHPKKMEKIVAAKGRLTVDNSQDPELVDIYHDIKTSTRSGSFNEKIINQAGYDQFIAVSYLPETDWYFVTIYPKSLIRETANSAAIFIIIVGLISLVVDIALLYFIFKKKISEPLEQFIQATHDLERGQTTAALPVERKDEIGKLSRSFESMAKKLGQGSQKNIDS